MSVFIPLRIGKQPSRALARRRARGFRLAVELLEDRLAPSVTVNVNATSNVRAIDPNIYGTAWADTASLKDLNFTLNREGGNTASTYNWQQNAGNHGQDWFYESISEN